MTAILSFLLGVTLLLALALIWRLRREHRQAFDELPTGICAIANGNRIEAWNEAMSALSTIAPEDALGLSIDSLPAPWAQALDEVLGEPAGKIVKRALGEEAADGPRWIILHSGPTNRSAHRRLVLVEDITDYQRLQDELLHKERLASIGRLAAGVAHEIGNPVTGIACVAQNLVDTNDAVELQQGTSEILKQTERITRTVSSLMQLSHPGSAEQEVYCIPCNLADCVDEAIHLLSLGLDAREVSFENHCDRELLVRADAQLLLQVFLNLLDNGRSAAQGEGPVLINAESVSSKVMVTVDNPGEPISSTALAQVFEPFYTTKDVGEGTGLGLPLVRRMLEDMGASVSLSSPSPSFADRGVRATLWLAPAEYDAHYTGTTDNHAALN